MPIYDQCDIVGKIQECHWLAVACLWVSIHSRKLAFFSGIYEIIRTALLSENVHICCVLGLSIITF